MAWETRRGRGRYFTRSKRVGKRVIREYLGTGPAAELAAELDALERAARAAAAATWRTERARLEELDAAVAAFDRSVEALARAALLAAGYHQHHRGEWRRRRDGHRETAG